MGRLAATLFLGAALLTAAVVPFIRTPDRNLPALFVVAGAAALVGGGAWFAPWERWGRSSTLALIPPAFALIGLGNLFAGSLPTIYGAYWMVTFVWIGVAHPRWTALSFAPLGALAYVLTALHFTGNATAAAESAALVIPMCALLGEALSFASAMLARAESEARRFGRLYGERNEVLRTLQRDLLPPEIPVIPGLDVAARYSPAEAGVAVGGDFYDVFPMADGSWGLVIGDVSGKGPGAAAITGLARFTIRALAQREVSPKAILAGLNRALLEQVGDSRFCTVCFVRVALEDGRAVLTVADGGHPVPLIVRPDGAIEEIPVRGTLLGVYPDPDLEEVVRDLRTDDVLFAYTDGMTEGWAGPQPSLERWLREQAGTWRGKTADAVADLTARRFVDPALPSRDDCAFIVARVAAIREPAEIAPTGR